MTNNQIPTIEQLRKRLEPYNLAKVAELSGVSRNSLYRLMKNEAQPSYETVVKLVNWMDSNEKQ